MVLGAPQCCVIQPLDNHTGHDCESFLCRKPKTGHIPPCGVSQVPKREREKHFTGAYTLLGAAEGVDSFHSCESTMIHKSVCCQQGRESFPVVLLSAASQLLVSAAIWDFRSPGSLFSWLVKCYWRLSGKVY